MMIWLLNPNSNATTTRAMCDIAARKLSPITGWTAPEGSAMLVTELQLDAAARQIEAFQPPSSCEGIIVAAFGDPGAAALAQRVDCPVIGMGAAAAAAAGKGGRRFAVATTTPHLKRRIDLLMTSHAVEGQYLGSYVTEGDPTLLMKDPARLDALLYIEVQRAASDGAEAVIIGGGPLAEAAKRLALHCAPQIINPVIEAADFLRMKLTRGLI